jgi:hypothetical protein
VSGASRRHWRQSTPGSRGTERVLSAIPMERPRRAGRRAAYQRSRCGLRAGASLRHRRLLLAPGMRDRYLGRCEFSSRPGSRRYLAFKFNRARDIPFERAAVIADPDVHRLIGEHGFSNRELSYHLNEGGKFFEYGMVIKSRDRANADALSQHLSKLPGTLQDRAGAIRPRPAAAAGQRHGRPARSRPAR